MFASVSYKIKKVLFLFKVCMKQLIMIHGGNVFCTEDDFYVYLQEKKYNPFEEKKYRSDRLSNKLKEQYQIAKPLMPNNKNASYKAWKIWFEKALPYLNDEDLIIAGNSLWAMFLIKYLGENTFPKKIKQLHLIAGVFDESDMSDEEKYAWDFAYSPEIIPNIEKQVESIFLYHSKDDPSVPYSHAEKIKAYLPKAKFVTFTDRGHFSQAEFPELLENIIK